MIQTVPLKTLVIFMPSRGTRQLLSSGIPKVLLRILITTLFLEIDRAATTTSNNSKRLLKTLSNASKLSLIGAKDIWGKVWLFQAWKGSMKPNKLTNKALSTNQTVPKLKLESQSLFKNSNWPLWRIKRKVMRFSKSWNLMKLLKNTKKELSLTLKIIVSTQIKVLHTWSSRTSTVPSKISKRPSNWTLHSWKPMLERGYVTKNWKSLIRPCRHSRTVSRLIRPTKTALMESAQRKKWKKIESQRVLVNFNQIVIMKKWWH